METARTAIKLDRSDAHSWFLLAVAFHESGHVRGYKSARAQTLKRDASYAKNFKPFDR